MQWLHEALCSQKGQDQTLALPLQMSDLLSYISHSKTASVFHLDKIVTVVVSTLLTNYEAKNQRPACNN